MVVCVPRCEYAIDCANLQDMIFQATWSYDMYTRHPLVLCAGKQGILYMLDGLTHECLRVFRGHGDVSGTVGVY